VFHADVVVGQQAIRARFPQTRLPTGRHRTARDPRDYDPRPPAASHAGDMGAETHRPAHHRGPHRLPALARD
jgi:hypothetical protein